MKTAMPKPAITLAVICCLPKDTVLILVLWKVLWLLGWLLVRHKFLLFRDDGWGREDVVKRRYNMVWVSASNQYQTIATSPANSPRATRVWTSVETAAPATNQFSQLKPGS